MTADNAKRDLQGEWPDGNGCFPAGSRQRRLTRTDPLFLRVHGVLTIGQTTSEAQR
jgi:hypothetical protein